MGMRLPAFLLLSLGAVASWAILPACSTPFGIAPLGDAGIGAVDSGGDASGAGCPTGTKLCAGACVDVTDPAYGCAANTCERCSVPFAETLKCSGNSCAAATCQAGRGHCSTNPADGCEADLLSPKTCLSCTTACPVGASFCTTSGCAPGCPGGTTDCNKSCVDVTTSSAHCGQCNKACPGAQDAVGKCENSQCGITCNVGYAECGNRGCVQLTNYYADADGDQVGAGPKVGEACAPPAGHAATGNDCDDGNKLVHPGQTAFFADPYIHSVTGLPLFDYDCSDIDETDRPVDEAKCGPAPESCRPGYIAGVPNAGTICGANTVQVCSGNEAIIPGPAGPIIVCGSSKPAEPVNCH